MAQTEKPSEPTMREARRIVKFGKIALIRTISHLRLAREGHIRFNLALSLNSVPRCDPTENVHSRTFANGRPGVFS